MHQGKPVLWCLFGLHPLDSSLRAPTTELSFQISQHHCRNWHRRQWASLTVSLTKPVRVACLEVLDALLEVRQIRPRPLVSNATHLGRCLEGPRCMQGHMQKARLGPPWSRNAKVTTLFAASSVGYQSQGAKAIRKSTDPISHGRCGGSQKFPVVLCQEDIGLVDALFHTRVLGGVLVGQPYLVIDGPDDFLLVDSQQARLQNCGDHKIGILRGNTSKGSDMTLDRRGSIITDFLNDSLSSVRPAMTFKSRYSLRASTNLRSGVLQDFAMATTHLPDCQKERSLEHPGLCKETLLGLLACLSIYFSSVYVFIYLFIISSCERRTSVELKKGRVALRS